jgi:aspartate aminotransferase-like enzyme
VSLVFGLDVALDLILAEGMEEVWKRRALNNRAVLAAGEAMGLEAYAQRVSPAVAAMRTPAGIHAPDVVTAVAARGARIAGGQNEAKPHLLRPSVLGWFDGYDAVALAAILEDALRSVGVNVPVGAGTRAAMDVLVGD